MEKLVLRPKELSVQPEAPDAQRSFAYWLRTVEDFISTLAEFRKDGDPEINKKRIIVSCLSPEIYPYVEDADTYENVVEILKSAYIKKKNNVYARHLLVSRRQAANETISEFLQALKSLAKDCTFADVKAAEYRDELTRDSFINNLSSSSIRQRLLEKNDINLTQAYELADSLDRAQRQSLQIHTTSAQPVTVASTDTTACIADNSSSLPPVASETRSVSSGPPRTKQSKHETCFYCGLNRHINRSSCPAREEICHSCGKLGHFSRVCRSKTNRKSDGNRSNSSASAFTGSALLALRLA